MFLTGVCTLLDSKHAEFHLLARDSRWYPNCSYIKFQGNPLTIFRRYIDVNGSSASRFGGNIYFVEQKQRY